MTGGRGCHPPDPPISALPHRQPPDGSYCGMSRGEPAIPGLDWTFTPRRGSEERFAHQHPFGPPRRFRTASPCPRLDRPASGRTAETAGEHTPPLAEAAGSRFPSGSGLSALSLASAVHSLARSSKRTQRLRHVPARTRTSRCFPSPGLPFEPLLTIPGRFQALFTPLLGVLFSFRSPYYCAIGLGTYLALGVDDPQLPARIPTRGTQETPPCNREAYAYGALTLYGGPFQTTSASPHGIRQGPTTPHPSRVTTGCSVWAVPLSVAPTHGIAFAFFSCGYTDVSFPRVPAPNGASPKGQDCPFGNPGF